MPMDTCPSRADLEAFQLGDLPDDAADAVAAHLETCSACEAAAQALDGVSDSVLAVLQQATLARTGLTPTDADAASDCALIVSPQRQPSLPRALGQHEILEELGRGGMGVVYKARHARLNRIVAVKVLLDSGFGDPQRFARFRREAEAVARLQHPNIVQIFDVGEYDDGTGRPHPYFTLEWVDGGNLAARTSGKPQPSRQAAEWLETIARAVQYAHEQGVVHRDLKPSNVLLTKQGQLKLCDFGVAKCLESEEAKTQSGMLLGTPEFMSPEQASGEGAVGPAADIHALGALLYALLTSRPPFHAANTLDTLSQVRTQEPVSVRRLQPTVPRDLDTICTRCLQKDPAKRYPSAAAVAEDLRRFLAGEPIKARPVSPVERTLRWARRRPAWSAVLALTLFIIAVGVPAVVALWLRADRALQDTRIANDRLEQIVYDHRIALAANAIANNDVLTARALLEQCEPRDSQPDRRGWEWRYLHRQAYVDLYPDMQHSGNEWNAVHAVGFHPDGRRAFSAAGLPAGSIAGHAPDAHAKTAGEIKIWDVTTGQCIARLNGHAGAVWAAGFSPDGRFLASGGAEGTVRIRRVDDGDRFTDVPGPKCDGSAVWSLAFSPDSRYLAVATWRSVCVWDLEANKLRATLPSGGRHNRALFGPEGKTLLIVNGEEAPSFTVWDLESASPKVRQNGPQGVFCTALSDDGQFLALAADLQSVIEVRDPQGEKVLRHLHGHTGPVTSLVFLPDGRLASGSDDATIRLWDVNSERELSVWRGHLHGIRSLACSRDGGRLVSGGVDRLVKLWDIGRDPKMVGFALGSNGEYLARLAFMEDGHRIRVVYLRSEAEGTLVDTVLDVDTRGIQRGVRFPVSVKDAVPRNDIFLSADGRLLAAPDPKDPHKATIWQAPDWPEQASFALRDAPAKYLSVSEDGRRAALVGSRKTEAGEAGDVVAELAVFEVESGRELWRQDLAPRISAGLTFSPDGRQLAASLMTVGRENDRITLSATSEVYVWDAADGRELLHLEKPFEEPVRALAFSSDGKRLAASGAGGGIRVLDVMTGTDTIPALQVPALVTGLAFSPDGTRLAATGMDNLTRLWNTSTGNLLLTLRGSNRPGTGHYGFVGRVIFSADGNRIAANHWDATVTVWDATP